MSKVYEIFSLGDHSLTLQTGDKISLPVNAKMVTMAEWLRQQHITGLQDAIPSYNSVTIIYDVYPIRKSGAPDAAAFMRERLKEAWQKAVPAPRTALPVNRLPVCYEEPYCLDKQEVMQATGLHWEDIVKLHSERVYQVFLLGFLPGFPYMGVLPDVLKVARKETPRQQVPAGSVGIAAGQTGIYPVSSPGGWCILGCTPVPMFDPSQEHPTYFAAGDQVQFYPVSAEEFRMIKEKHSPDEH